MVCLPKFQDWKCFDDLFLPVEVMFHDDSESKIGVQETQHLVKMQAVLPMTYCIYYILTVRRCFSGCAC